MATFNTVFLCVLFFYLIRLKSKGHSDDVYVFESHPVNNNVILSAGHDGNLILWDIVTGEQKKKIFNEVPVGKLDKIWIFTTILILRLKIVDTGLFSTPLFRLKPTKLPLLILTVIWSFLVRILISCIMYIYDIILYIIFFKNMLF